jgi:hypothetical protein
MAFLMKNNVVFYPAQVSLFGLDAVMLDTNQVTNLVEQFCHRARLPIRYNAGER